MATRTNLPADPPVLTVRSDKWNRGLNTLVSPTAIRLDEVSEATDVQIIEDGKIQVPRDGQAYYGGTSGSRVYGLFPYYKSDGTQALLRMGATALQSYNTGTTSWDTVSGKTYTSSKNANGVMAYDRLYICNGSDNLTYFDGTLITTFSQVVAPTNPSVARSGGNAGSFTYSYKVTSVTATGESDPTAAFTTTADYDVSAMSATNYMTVTFTAATSAIGYNVYGRRDGKWFFLKYLDGNTSVTYKDTGSDVPSEWVTPPLTNYTAGVKGTLIELYKDALFIAGDSANPSRVYYSAGGDLINDFSAANGGGFIDISKNDGQKVTGLKVFKDRLIIFKENSIYQFTFSTSGAPTLSMVTGAIGCIAPRSVVAVENDVWFLSRRGVFTIGNAVGFAFDVLRTNEVSSKIRSLIQTIDPAYIQNTAAIYTTKSNANLVIFSYTPSGSTTNSKAIVFDTERLCWVAWNNINANCWASYKDASGAIHYLYGADNSGYVCEVLTGSSDFGSSLTGTLSLRGEGFGAETEIYKVLKDLTFLFRKPVGSINLKVIVDGVTTALTTNINTVSPSINLGHYLPTKFLLGKSYGTGAVTSSDTIAERKKRNLNLLGKTFTLSLSNSGANTSFTLLSVTMTAKQKSPKFTKSGELIS